MKQELSDGVAVAQAKARVLNEALAYIRQFAGHTFIIKFSGHLISEHGLAESLAADIALMHLVGLRIVIVHGGGPQITTLTEERGLDPVFIDGHRVTDTETLELVREALVDNINRQVVHLINHAGAVAVGLTGEDANLLQAIPLHEALGYVGDVEGVDPTIIIDLLDDNMVPVVAPLAVGPDGQTYNVNADTVAASLAVALSATKLVLLSDVDGVYADWPECQHIIHTLSISELETLLDGGQISAGMLPKLAACQTALDGGVPRVHVLSGHLPHALLLEFFTSEGVGTMVSGDF